MIDSPRTFAKGTRSEPIEISSDESGNESGLDSLTNFSREKQFSRILRSKLPMRETPIRQRLVTAPSTSSASSSSTTASSIFDTGMKDAVGTPLTPPLPDSTSAKITNVRTHDTNRQIFAQKKISEARSYFVANPPSQTRPSTPNVEEEDTGIDKTSSGVENPSSESPITQRHLRKKKGERLQEEVDDSLGESSDPPAPKEKFGQDTKGSRQNSRDGRRRRDPVPSSSPGSASSRNAVEDKRGSASHNKKSTSKAPTIESENDLSAEEKSDVSINSVLIPIRRLSPPESNHKRSRSAPKIGYALEVGDIDASQSIMQANERSHIDPVLVPSSAPKSRKRGSSSLSATTRQARSRSTGSIPNVPQASTREKGEIDPAVPIAEPAQAPSTNKPKSTAKPQSVLAAEKRRLERTPHFTRHETKIDKMTRKDVNIQILDAVRNENAEKRYRLRLRRQISQIWNWIWNGGSKSKRVFDAQYGFIYIFKVDEFESSAPGHLKIGQTKDEVSKRLSRWDYKCDIKARHISDDNDKRFRHYDTVEKIVHAELCDERRDYKCWCGVGHGLAAVKGSREKTGHTEWFKVEKENALAVVEKWRAWAIRMQPYNSDGTLRARWIWKHSQATCEGVVDWVAFRDFSLSEVYKCCFDRLWELLGKSWRFEIFSLEFHIFWIIGFVSIYVGRASISTLHTWVALLCLYIFCWFNFE